MAFSALLVGAAVAFAGSIGFVGLVVPHLVRLLAGPDHRVLLPASALLGAALEMADNWLNLQRVELTVYTDNPGAQALYRKFGFVEEGLARGFAFRQGEYVDALYMARIRP